MGRLKETKAIEFSSLHFEWKYYILNSQVSATLQPLNDFIIILTVINIRIHSNERIECWIQQVILNFER